MNKPPTSRTVHSGHERRGRIPDASIPDWAAHKRRQARPVGQRQRAAQALQPTARKRGGARFGPPPKELPHKRMQAPEPMLFLDRLDAYTADGARGLTHRQGRQFDRMSDRDARRDPDVAVRAAALRGSKGRPTPKRGAR
jgi:hypothetical protein